MVVIPYAEFRRFDRGVGQKSGKPWYRISFEDSNAYSYMAYIPEETAAAFSSLKKGDLINLQAELSNRDGALGLRVTGFQLIDDE